MSDSYDRLDVPETVRCGLLKLQGIPDEKTAVPVMLLTFREKIANTDLILKNVYTNMIYLICTRFFNIGV